MRRVACVFAHPDDDTFGVSGSLALHARDDLELTVILATSGEAGRIADASLATRETLASVREAEDLASWRALGLEPDLRFLRHPDGGLEHDPARARSWPRCGALLDAVAPEVRRHVRSRRDHRARRTTSTIGRVATEAFGALRTSASGPAFSRLLHTARSRRAGSTA